MSWLSKKGASDELSSLREKSDAYGGRRRAQGPLTEIQENSSQVFKGLNQRRTVSRVPPA